MVIISEAALYKLIARSRKPEAEKFMDWVFEEVLPEIRKTGAYTGKKPTNAELILQQAEALVAHERLLAKHDERLDEHGDRISILEGGRVPNGYLTVKRYASKYRIRTNNAEAQRIGKRASRLCKERGIEIHHQEDKDFDTVGAYPETILKEAFQTEKIGH